MAEVTLTLKRSAIQEAFQAAQISEDDLPSNAKDFGCLFLNVTGIDIPTQDPLIVPSEVFS